MLVEHGVIGYCPSCMAPGKSRVHDIADRVRFGAFVLLLTTLVGTYSNVRNTRLRRISYVPMFLSNFLTRTPPALYVLLGLCSLFLRYASLKIHACHDKSMTFGRKMLQAFTSMFLTQNST
jgi:hypothetical protein